MLLSKQHTREIFENSIRRGSPESIVVLAAKGEKKESEISWPWKLLLLLFSSSPEKKISHFFRAGFSSPFTFIFSAWVLLFFAAALLFLLIHTHSGLLGYRISLQQFRDIHIKKHISENNTQDRKQQEQQKKSCRICDVSETRSSDYTHFSISRFDRSLVS